MRQLDERDAKMGRMIQVVVLIGSLAVMAGPAHSEYFTDPNYKFSIEYPDNWEVIPGREQVTKLKVVGPLGGTCSAKPTNF